MGGGWGGGGGGSPYEWGGKGTHLLLNILRVFFTFYLSSALVKAERVVLLEMACVSR